MHASSSSPNVWPGYVAATAGIAIVLLLLIAILGGGLFALAQSAAHQLVQAESDTRLSEPTRPASIAPRRPLANAQSSGPGGVVSASLAASGARHEPPAPRDAGPGRIVLAFDDGAFALDESVRERLRGALATSSSDRMIDISARISRSATVQQRRAAFIRLMATRTALMDLAIDSSRIRTTLHQEDMPPAPEQPRTITLHVEVPLASTTAPVEISHAR